MPFAGTNWVVLKKIVRDRLDSSNTITIVHDNESTYKFDLGWSPKSDIQKTLEWVLKTMKDIELEDSE